MFNEFAYVTMPEEKIQSKNIILRYCYDSE